MIGSPTVRATDEPMMGRMDDAQLPSVLPEVREDLEQR